MSKRRRVKGAVCPTPDKTYFTDEANALARLTAVSKRHRRESTPTRAYRCECGLWHLTSWEVREFENFVRYRRTLTNQ